MTDKLRSSVDATCVQHLEHTTMRDEKKIPRGSRERQFLPRNSMLTDMMQVKHLRTIYNAFVAHFLVECLRAVSLGLASDKLDMSQDFILWNFGKPQLVLYIWLAMMGTTLGVYGCFRCWATRNYLFPSASSMLRCWDYTWVGVFAAYQMCFFYLPAVTVLEWDLPPVSTIIVTLEQVRMVMKSHAFVRSNAPRVVAHKTPTWSGPDFSHFLYFLFCPTLVYRDTYPRAARIRWWSVVKLLLEMLGVVVYLSFVLERWMLPDYKGWGLAPSSPQETISVMFDTVLPMVPLFLCVFFVIIHISQNIGAELTRFADRLFYQDWWTAESYNEYFRKWNIPVHDWLYAYVYRDLQEIFQPSSRTLPTLSVFLISSLVHEYVIAMVLGFCYPVITLMYVGVGGTLSLLPSGSSIGGNAVFWLFMLVGNAIHGSVFSMEWYARINCKQTQDGLSDFFIPRSWNCSPLSSTPLPRST